MPIHIPRVFTGVSADSRKSISLAALLVNVTASTDSGVAWPVATYGLYVLATLLLVADTRLRFDRISGRMTGGKVATAVRQFDTTAPGRRWLRAMQKQGRFRRWLAEWGEGEGGGFWVLAIYFLIFFGAVIAAYSLGYQSGKQAAESPGIEAKDD